MAIVGSFLSLVLLLLVLDILTPSAAAPAGEAKAPAIYVFGDSTADVGNNNNLPRTTAKANFPHYGIDFPSRRPTGRFSNGYNGVDFIVSHLGFQRSPPPFLSLRTKASHSVMRGLRGLSFASGGSGILDTTGDTITMSKQVHYFSTIRSNLTIRMSTETTDALLSKSIFLISSGGNDIFAYFSQNKFANNTQKEQFIANLVSKFESHVTKLYNLGARKIVIVDVPPLGCLPYPRGLSPTGACIDVLNELALGFNEATKVSLHNLGTKLKGMRYSIGSSYAVVMSIIRNPAALGFIETKTACCGGGKFNGQSSCTAKSTLCSDRDRYLFWDMLHPTHKTSKIAGLAMYSGSLDFASPINFKQLLEADS